MRQRLGRAFTLVELVIVIAIVGILAAIAIPRFIDIRTEAHNAARDSVIGSVRAGILTVASQNQVKGGAGTFPTNLEVDWNGIGGGGTLGAAGDDCLTANPCFELVVSGGLVESNWEQNNAAGTVYKFTHPIDAGENKTCTYTAGTKGTFLCP